MINEFRTLQHAEFEVIVFQRVKNLKNISFEVFDRVLKCLTKASQAPANIFDFRGKKTLQDFYFSHGNVRSRIEIGFAPKNIHKKKVCIVNAMCAERNQFHFTFHLKQEIPVKNPSISSPSFIRLQEVWEFVYKEAFIYTLKKVCAGKTKEQACQEVPTYEMELELIPHSSYLKNKTNEEMAESLIEKCLDLVGRFDVEGERINLHLNWIAAPASRYKKKRHREAGIITSSSASSIKKEKNE